MKYRIKFGNGRMKTLDYKGDACLRHYQGVSTGGGLRKQDYKEILIHDYGFHTDELQDESWVYDDVYED